jgi:hypothetical protein
VSASQATSYRPLVPLEELRRLRPGEGVVIYGQLRPARIQVRPHFTAREQRWRARLERQASSAQERAGRKAARAQERAELIADAEAAGRKLTGAQLGRAIGRSDRYGRLLLREFRAADGTSGNGEPPQ